MDNKVSAKRSLQVIAIILFIFSLLIRIINGTVFGGEELLYYVSIETTLFTFLIITTLKKWLGSYLKITIFFVIMYCLYMMGQLLLLSIGALDGMFLDGKFSYYDCIDSIMDVHMYLAFFIFGLTLAKKYKNSYNYSPDSRALKIGYKVLAFSFPFYIIVVGIKIFFVSSYGYASLYQDTALNAIPSAFKIMSYFFLPGVFYVFFASKRKSKHEKIAIGLLTAYSVFNLILGYRMFTITPILLLMYALKVKQQGAKNKIGKGIITLIVISGLLVLFIFPAVRESRNTGGITTMSISEVFSNNELFETIHDMGKSLQTHIYTKNLVPSQYPYRYGYTYIMNLSTALPNFFWERHPAEVYGSLGRWLTKIVDYDFYMFGGALGYSCVAEAYINFGYLGLILIPLLFGLILMTLENKVDHYNTPLNYASFCIVSMYLVSYSRGEFSDLIRGLFWYMLVPRLIYKYSK